MSSRAYLAWNMIELAESEDIKEREIISMKRKANFSEVKKIVEKKRFESICDDEFTTVYRLNKKAFVNLIEILRKETGMKSTQRVSLESQVCCALSFYANGGLQSAVGKANNFSQETISSYIEGVTTALTNPNVANKIIQFPTTREQRDSIKKSFQTKYNIPGVVGCIDCSHFKIFTPYKEERHLFHNCKDFYSLNVQMVCDSDCNILSVNAKFGGNAHDDVIWEASNVNSYMQYLHRNDEIVWLLGDSAYPQTPWLMTPYINPQHDSLEDKFNQAHASARSVIGHTFRRLRNRWRCLDETKMLLYNPTKCANIINACCVLHNIALKYQVPDPEPDPVIIKESVAEEEVAVHLNDLNEETTDSDLIRGQIIRDQLARRMAERLNSLNMKVELV